MTHRGPQIAQESGSCVFSSICASLMFVVWSMLTGLGGRRAREGHVCSFSSMNHLKESVDTDLWRPCLQILKLVTTVKWLRVTWSQWQGSVVTGILMGSGISKFLHLQRRELSFLFTDTQEKNKALWTVLARRRVRSEAQAEGHHCWVLQRLQVENRSGSQGGPWELETETVYLSWMERKGTFRHQTDRIRCLPHTHQKSAVNPDSGTFAIKPNLTAGAPQQPFQNNYLCQKVTCGNSLSRLQSHPRRLD